MPRLLLPEYAVLLSKALSCFSFPTVTLDFHSKGERHHEDMRGVEACIGAALRCDDVADVRDGLSDVLFWGYARQGRRDFRVRNFQERMQSVDGQQRLAMFQEFVRSRRETCTAQRLLALRKLRLPEFGQVSFATKILMFLDPENHPVLDLKIARTARGCEFPPLRGLTIHASIPITIANAACYERWACWCRDIAARVNRASGSPCQGLRAVDVERALFALADSERTDDACRLLKGPQGYVSVVLSSR